jgi:enoyl-CoA hydratase/carnithine racemase
MKVSISNQIKTIQLGDKGPNLLTVERQRSIIRELSLNDSKAIIILGNDQVFSAGLNLKDLTAASTKEEVGEIFSSLSNLLQSIRKFPGPVISVISGHAIAGGCLLALASDYRIGMFGKQRMGLNEMAIGIDLPLDMLTIISQTIRRDYLFEVASQCRLYSPKECFQRGLINEYFSNPFIGKKRATKKAIHRAEELAQFYIAAGEPFIRLKESLLHGKEFSGDILIENWFNPSTQEKIQNVLKSLQKK